MNDQSRRWVCRIAFLLVCLVPSVMVLSSVINQKLAANSKPVESDSGQKNPANERDKQGKAGDFPKNQKNQPSESTLPDSSLRIQFSDQLMLPLLAGANSRSRVISPDDIPAQHPLKKLNGDVFRISEYADLISIEIEKADLTLDQLFQIKKELLNPANRSIFFGDKPVDARIRLLNLMSHQNASNPNLPVLQTQIREVRIRFSPTDSLANITGLLQVDADEPGVENLFTRRYIHIGGLLDASKSTFEFAGNLLPSWIMGKQLRLMTGDFCRYSGKLQTVLSSDSKSEAIRFLEGDFKAVRCEQLIAWLANVHQLSFSRSPITGYCSVEMESGVFDKGEILVLNSRIKSDTRGRIQPEFTRLLPNQFIWNPDVPELETEFLGFQFNVVVQNQQLRISTEYENQYLWKQNQPNDTQPVIMPKP